ncbi:Decarbamoylnovobiocin carbamoyltransferase [compost metagenome]
MTEEENGIYYRLIKEYAKLTGIPLILNTSFNVNGEPIVETPADALNCYKSTNIDMLVIGDYIICK